MLKSFRRLADPFPWKPQNGKFKPKSQWLDQAEYDAYQALLEEQRNYNREYGREFIKREHYARMKRDFAHYLARCWVKESLNRDEILDCAKLLSQEEIRTIFSGKRVDKEKLRKALKDLHKKFNNTDYPPA